MYLTKVEGDSTHGRQANAEITLEMADAGITPEMIEAGMDVLAGYDPEADTLRKAVTKILRAALAVRP